MGKKEIGLVKEDVVNSYTRASKHPLLQILFKWTSIPRNEREELESKAAKSKGKKRGIIPHES